MKNLNSALLLLVVLSIFGCSPDAKFQKAVNIYGQKESVKFITEKYPEYFLHKRDTVRDTVIIKEAKIDSGFSLLNLRDTIFIQKDRLVLKAYMKHDSVFINAKCKTDTIYKLVQCPEYLTPDSSKIDSGLQAKLETAFKIGLLILFGLFIFVLFLCWRQSQRHKN